MVLSAFAQVHRCHLTWRRARQTLLEPVHNYETSANKHRILAPACCVGQQVWLSISHLPLRLESKKLALHFMGLFPISKVVNPMVVWLRLLKPVWIHPNFHVSTVKPVTQNTLSALDLCLCPPILVDRHCFFSTLFLLDLWIDHFG